MKSKLPGWNLLFLAMFVVSACGPSGSEQPTSTTQPRGTPTLQATQAQPTVVPSTATEEPERLTGEIAYAHVQAISEGIGPRVAGSEAEGEMGQYLVLAFERLGYASELHPFTVELKGKTINSANVIAIKPGESRREIIVGAHYDSVEVGTGADDNASGVGVLLEVAERLRGQETPYTIRFILFGAEEVGLLGSRDYVSRLTVEQIQNTVAMVNLDSLTAGDIAYIYGDAGERGAIRNWALEFAAQEGLELQTQPGENPKYPAGTTGDWSDHAPFKAAGIPYTYLESTNWTLGDKDGYTQVSTEYGENGAIWHTQYDTVEYINSTFRGRMQERLALFVTVLEAILTEFSEAQ